MTTSEASETGIHPPGDWPIPFDATSIYNSNGNAWEATGDNIQKAIDDQESGGHIWLPPIEFLVDTAISIANSSVHLWGVPTWVLFPYNTGTILKATASISEILEVTGFFCSVNNIAFNGDNKATYGINLDNQDGRIIGCSIAYCDQGIRRGTKLNAWIWGNWIEYNRVGMRLEAFDYLWILDNLFSGNTDYDIAALGTPGENLWIRDNKGNGENDTKAFFLNTAPINNLTSRDNQLTDYTDAIYDIDGNLSYARISDDIVDGNSHTDYYIDTAATTTLTDCKATQCSVRNMATAVFNEAGGHFDKKNIYGFNPLGAITNPFDTTDNTIGHPAGNAASPSASTDYTVRGVDVYISSTDSGNTDCAIMLKDPSGNNLLQSTLSTIQDMYIPLGYKLNWGAFTGAAPTVTVSGN